MRDQKNDQPIKIEHCAHCTLARAIVYGFPRKGTK